MFKVNYTKVFTNGMLKSIEFQSSISFPNIETACDFVDFCRDHVTKPVQSISGSDYTCHNPIIENIHNELNKHLKF